jgi:hypothetical protein
MVATNAAQYCRLLGIPGVGRSPVTLVRPFPASTIGDESLDRVNAELPWDEFDTRDYLDHNYRTLRDDDQQIIHLLAEFFRHTGVRAGRGIDVGTGANLYPALAMLPFCTQLVLCDRAASNIAWLRDEVTGYAPLWDKFWEQLAGHEPYRDVHDARREMAIRARVRHGNIFELATGRWDIGTMFFVAESLSGIRAEFDVALRRFVRALRPGAPLAAAFMVDSTGFTVGGQRFPAVAVSAEDIGESLARLADNVVIHRIDTTSPLRPGYGGMVLAVGYAGRGRRTGGWQLR